MKPITTFIIPSVRRDTLQRAIDSIGDNPYLVGFDDDHIGQSLIKNQLIAQVTTEWVSFLDDDDIILPNYVAALKHEIERHPTADIVHFKQYFTHTGQLFPALQVVKWGCIGVGFSVRRSVILEYPFQNEKHEDLHVVERIIAGGHIIYFSPELTYIMRPNF
jgi:hypothetical protein